MARAHGIYVDDTTDVVLGELETDGALPAALSGQTLTDVTALALTCGQQVGKVFTAPSTFAAFVEPRRVIPWLEYEQRIVQTGHYAAIVALIETDDVLAEFSRLTGLLAQSLQGNIDLDDDVIVDGNNYLKGDTVDGNTIGSPIYDQADVDLVRGL